MVARELVREAHLAAVRQSFRARRARHGRLQPQWQRPESMGAKRKQEHVRTRRRGWAAMRWSRRCAHARVDVPASAELADAHERTTGS